MRDTPIERVPDDGPLSIQGPVVAEVLPEPERQLGQEDAATT